MVLDQLYREHVGHLEGRLASVMAEHGYDAVAIHSGSLVRRSQYDDQYWPMRGCPHFLHWAPLPEPDCLLLLRPGHRGKLARPAIPSFWEKAAPLETRVFEDVFDVGPGPRDDDASATRTWIGPGRVAFVGEDCALASRWGIGDDDACPVALLRALDRLRTIKTPYEVACISEANRRARAGHDALRNAFSAGDSSELDLHLLFLQATSQDDSETPYKNIVAIGESAATLHHISYGRHPHNRAAESLLVDAGATCRGYGSDITRTWTKGSGAAADLFARLVTSIEAMQRDLCATLRVGLPYEELHDESHRRLAGILRDLGVLRSSAEEAVARGITRAFYPHGLGHSLGLQTHDVGCALRPPRPDNAFLRNTTDICAGQVFTIEPGVYFIPSLLAELRGGPNAAAVDWTTVEVLAPLGGVRVEDDIHMLADQGRNLTREHLAVGGSRVG